MVMAPGVLESLKLLGLTEYESKAYHALVALGRADAGPVAAAAGLPATRVHDVLRDLHSKQWVRAEAGRPVRYVPCAPRERMSSEWSRLTRGYEEAVADLDMAFTGRSIIASAPVWFIQGEEAVAQRLVDLASSAKDQLALTLPFRLDTDADTFIPALRRAARRGVRVRIIALPNEDFGQAPWLATVAAGCEIRALALPVRIAVADFETALLIPPWPPGGRMTAMWNPIREFVQLLRPAFDTMWLQAKPLPSEVPQRGLPLAKRPRRP